MKQQILVLDDNQSFEKISRLIGDAYLVSPFTEQTLEQQTESIEAIFFRMDSSLKNSLSRFRAIRRHYDGICLVWMSARDQDAVDAFACNADAFLHLPATEQTVTDVLKRLNHISHAREKTMREIDPS